MNAIPTFPLAKYIDAILNFFTDNFSFITKAVSEVTKIGLDYFETALLFLPPIVMILLITALTYYVAGRGVAIISFAGLLLIWNIGLWDATMNTLSLVLAATIIAVGIGLPLGILAALNDKANKIVMPILDFMQTMPAFVYLIPAIPFFGLGKVSAVFATVIFGMPPAIRLTSLGIRQVPAELIEASDAFGTTWKQKLMKVQLPMAVPTIMAGINQTIMLSLSMVVIAAMIGAGGLGGEVLRAIQRFQPGKGFEAGLGVVILAIILDRITQNIGKKYK
ncbi:MAG: proline/glycine betaine ABC transporter permease [Clostridia bacterium]|jgi:glycine betaine/proline transport system permease protein|nr:proline/glycine betaine ABC transporter permease [Clostridia bacterium]